MSTNEEHLSLISKFHYVMAVLAGLFGCFPLIHLTLGIIMILNPESMRGDSGEAAPLWAGWLFAFIGGLFFIALQSFTVGIFLSARWLARRKNKLFSMIMAGVLCAAFPLGTALGAYTLIILTKPEADALYSAPQSGAV